MIKRYFSSGVKHTPVISGPGTLMIALTSPSASITMILPFSVLSAKSKCATNTSPEEETARAVGPLEIAVFLWI